MTDQQIENIAPEASKQIWALFAGAINQDSVHRLFQAVQVASNNQIEHIHLLFQTYGGTVTDGVCLYNFFRALPIELSLYNVGGVQSAGVIAFLGARERFVSQYASFMIHRTTSPALAVGSERLQGIADSVAIDDVRMEAILRAELNLSATQWAIHKVSDLWLSAADAETIGLAQVGEFAPPAKTQIYNL